MRGLMASAIVCVCLFLSAASAQQPPPAAPAAPVTPTPIAPAIRDTIARLQQQAATSELAYEITESVTTEVGARMAGSPEEARARDWAVAKLKSLGFQNVRIEPFPVPYWARTYDRGEIVGPHAQKLVIAAIGGSGATPEGGLTAEIVRFTSLDGLTAAPDSAVAGKIVFIDEPTLAAMDGAGYGLGVLKRGLCAPNAKRKGAVACLIRSVGTHSHRFAHQGGNARARDGANIPAAQVSPPDADQLTRLLRRGPVRVKLEINVEVKDDAPSGNVIGEVIGREKPEEIVLISAHLDSWDQATGALDDGAGIGIVTAAAKLIRDLPRRPRRTIRVVYFGSEETGIHGALAYARLHQAQLANHIIASESDFGAGRIWRFQSRFGAANMGHAPAMHQMLAPLGITRGGNEGTSGPDITPFWRSGVPVFDLGQNGMDYFNYHHTPDDTLDKIDRAELRQNVQAWVTATYLAAETDWVFR